MSYFIFNGIDSREYGILEAVPMPPASRETVSEVDVEGRTKKPLIYTGVYENMPIPCVLGLKSKERIREIYRWLSGTGNLIFSEENDKLYHVRSISLAPERLSVRFGKVNVEFTVEPFAYAVNPTGQVITQDFEIIRNGGSIFAAPEIMLKPRSAGDISIDVNGASFVIKVPSELVGKTVIVDCEVQVAYYLGDNNEKISITHMTYNDFPLLKTGENYIRYSGSASDVVCNVRERWL